MRPDFSKRNLFFLSLLETRKLALAMCIEPCKNAGSIHSDYMDCVCVCKYHIYINMCTYLYIFICRFVCVHNIHIKIYVCAYIYVRIKILIHIYIHM